MSAKEEVNPTTSGAVPAPVKPHQELLAFLAEMNGQDCYDAKATAIGKLDSNHHLFVPQGFEKTIFNPETIGKVGAAPTVTDRIYAQIYVLNKPVFEGEIAQIKGALLRCELVKAGWCTGSYEVTEKPAPAEAMKTMAADLEKIKEYADDAKLLAMLLPLAAEHTFRTMGHHYISGMSQDYVTKYSNFFSACVKPHLVDYLPPDLLFHRIAHWVPLSSALTVSKNEIQKVSLPNAVVIRSTSAPAGTALISTSAAILDALSGTGLADSIGKASGIDTRALKAMSDKVKANPGKYHTIPSAYGNAFLAQTEAEEFATQKEEAKKLAPVLQGFLDSLPRTSDLAAARALAKHADVNPLLRKRARAFFKEVGTTKATTVSELFSMDKRAAAATEGTEIVDLEEDND